MDMEDFVQGVKSVDTLIVALVRVGDEEANQYI